ncbi:uncharacterized protein L3040_001810 [Drepanopeziza brunnea f. sp. 'multigermtubi']|uniref:Putative GPR1/FUN34/YaaH-class plasma membrane protein n=1 Tax=Marssonina brunnea f. sp. multigermtubi (strain MB_m1) TaxID=1072389 RepID=K1X409_MARBU|nr:putative GPR1/FUN34/YaaH-class plasma membrane protein [Drepanopeziza brunnea f. sp. 'multigermtubi' MB_m1]EKD15438.1 putative GPR1/FUN34/YaaH-class plasma membrane protein [Drepanopeziza brunnea f. sp. 'multigermtubi' MB_m1]KAJ5052050.1 hypothetical protein L3040_001810 [Drepanopeziza brunnea f. sp. 'multigermtubi']
MATEYDNAQARASVNGDPIEKDYGSNTGYQNGKNGAGASHLNDTNMSQGDALHRIGTAGSISISAELFEKIYLSPQNAVKGDLRKTFGNPTPVALIGFLICLSPLSAALMGWRGAGGSGAATTGAYYFFGGVLMLVGGILEFILGNTFPFVVFMSFGAFWLSFAATLQPFYGAYAAFSPDPTNPAAGLQTVGFTASYAFLLVSMGVLCFIYLVCALRTNFIFVVMFFTLTLAYPLLAGTYWQLANSIAQADPSKAALAGRLEIAAGACLFVTCVAGWYLLFAIMLATLDFPIQLPVGDLSTMFKGASEKAKARESQMA